MNFKYFLGVLALATLTFTVSCSSEEENRDASGTFEAREVIVSSEANGRIINLSLQEGKELIGGEIYGLIDTVQLSLKKRQLQALIDVAATKFQDVSLQTDALKERIKTANKEVKRVKNLISAGAANKKQLDDLNASLLVMKKELAATEYALNSVNKSIDAEINAMKVQLEQIDDQLVRSKIVSPISGIVLAQYAQEGELTGAGKPLFKVADLGNMFLRAYIISSQLTEIKVGQQVTVYADMGQDDSRTYEGTISWISDKAEFTPKTVQTKDERANLVYAVKIAFKNDGYAKIGMYGDIKF